MNSPSPTRTTVRSPLNGTLNQSVPTAGDDQHLHDREQGIRA